MTIPLAIATWPMEVPSLRAWGAAAVLGVVCTGFAFVMYYRLIVRIGASRAATSTYLVPLFGVGWAWWLLDEPLTPRMAVAGALILGSVVLSQRRT
jgi:drug/metabolite transporter (DMT)-like permease